MKTFHKILFILGFLVSITVSMHAVNIMQDTFMSFIGALCALTCLIGLIHSNKTGK